MEFRKRKSRKKSDFLAESDEYLIGFIFHIIPSEKQGRISIVFWKASMLRNEIDQNKLDLF